MKRRFGTGLIEVKDVKGAKSFIMPDIMDVRQMKRTRWCMSTVAAMSHTVYTDKATSLLKNWLEFTSKKWELRCAMVNFSE